MKCLVTQLQVAVNNEDLENLYSLPAEMESYISQLSFVPTLLQRKALYDFYSSLVLMGKWNALKFLYPMWGTISDCAHGIKGADITIPSGATVSSSGIDLSLCESDITFPNIHTYSSSRLSFALIADNLQSIVVDEKLLYSGAPLVAIYRSGNWFNFYAGQQSTGIQYSNLVGGAVVAGTTQGKIYLLNGNTIASADKTFSFSNNDNYVKIVHGQSHTQVKLLAAFDTPNFTAEQYETLRDALTALSSALFVNN